MFKHSVDRCTSRSFAATSIAVTIIVGGARTRACAQTCEEIEWRQVFPAISPPAVYYFQSGRMAYDSQRHLCVLVVQPEGDVPSQTWEWDGTTWAPRTLAGPALRSVGYAVAYDDAREVTLLFDPFGQTWTWDGEEWRWVTRAGPGGGYTPEMAFDSDRAVAVMYLGGDEHKLLEWNGASWTLRDSGPHEPDNPIRPAAEFGVAMCYDSNEHRTVVFGGAADYNNETWAWDGAQWTLLGRGGPSERGWASMTFDSTRGRRVLFGGAVFFSGNFLAFHDTWESDDAMGWTLVDETGPSERLGAPMVYDAARGSVVLFGGNGTNQTWTRAPRMLHAGPSIHVQPYDQDADLGETVSFRVAASGEGTITYQWRHNSEPLVDGPRIYGSHTPMITICCVRGADAGIYDVVVTNPCDSVPSRSARLTIPLCPADFNTDGIANSQDFFDFLNAFFALSPTADFDHSGSVDSNDFFAFLLAFFAGCT